jgi:DNA-binding NarL/FixJ family response regulator
MRILTADDNEKVRRGVKRIITSETDWTLCGGAADGADALRKARALLPDLILMDINMPGLRGLVASRLLLQQVPKAKIVIMSQQAPIHIVATRAGGRRARVRGQEQSYD